MPFDGAFSPVHILVVALVALLVLGPEELPKLARQAARGIREFRRVQHHLSTELRDVVSGFDSSQSGTAESVEVPLMLPPPEPDRS